MNLPILRDTQPVQGGAGVVVDSRPVSDGASRMTGSDLAFYTTQELIAELMSRQTFYGVIVHADGDYKRDDRQSERMFKVHVHRHLDAARASRLLGSVAEYMDVDERE